MELVFYGCDHCKNEQSNVIKFSVNLSAAISCCWGLQQFTNSTFRVYSGSNPGHAKSTVSFMSQVCCTFKLEFSCLKCYKVANKINPEGCKVDLSGLGLQLSHQAGVSGLQCFSFFSLGLDPKLLTSILSSATGRCWSVDTYNPVPGVMPNVPSSNNYQVKKWVH